MLSLDKPLKEFALLNKCLSKYGTRFEIPRQKECLFSENIAHDNTIVIQEGLISLRRQEQVLVGIGQAPVILGLDNGVMKNEVQYDIFTEGACSGYYLPSTKTVEVIEECQLWREACYWITWLNRFLELRDRQLIGNNSYEQIRSTLITMNEWEEALRSRIGVMNYIHQRTRISRSVVAEVLAALRKGGYIEMNKGKLVKINRLPYEY
ncbi:helix-turn-helix domain-containing protein [Citrobacter rodentium]|nr:helix-turn-helix domain-containing protein [Citrobacter rodentium]KIQ52753.1 transcriptional regulator [Citrobacter rodentium]QBY31644.1 transcriptional regulator [Citrobacter rodentium]UHO30998.1 helix-turn-helix domain-containing protein [Citrobacter rodentium NBRC 105723 = DSM 16636]HAT8015511.1 transcriptional regulator [Citrobacter rodentium NBRC 105723 = DSM 16636]HAT8020322.1 transcriptional regulator [Citrobacter rodentium]